MGKATHPHLGRLSEMLTRLDKNHSSSDELDAIWAEYSKMPYAAQQIYGCSGGDEDYGKPLRKYTLFDEVFSEEDEDTPDEYRITRKRYEEGFQFLLDEGLIILAANGTYTADEKCRYLATAVLAYQHTKAGLLPSG
jgi:hypothetical protein